MAEPETLPGCSIVVFRYIEYSTRAPPPAAASSYCAYDAPWSSHW